jgi:TRAP-type uncharacterized transport system substrate-binding protein
LLNKNPLALRIAIGSGLIVLLGLIFAAIDLEHNLSHMRVTVLSGPKAGEDYTLVELLVREAKRSLGTVTNSATEGIAANLDQLAGADAAGRTLFALVPDGLNYPQPAKLQLVARLPRARILFLLGPQADAIRYLSDLAGLHIGIGPPGSATALFGRELLGADFLKELKIVLSEQPFAEQLDQLKQGKLELGLFVMDADAPLIEQAVRDGLRIASFENAEALAARIPALKAITLYTGYFDQLRRLPQTDKKVFQVDLLMLTNTRVSRSQAVAMLVLLDTVFKGFIEVNRNTPNRTGLREIAALKPFLNNGGPTLLDQYVPRLLDFMPPANIVHYVVLLSLLLNGMSFWHRFRLWRIDARRLKLEELAFDLFGHYYTLQEIAQLTPRPGEFDARKKERLNELIYETQWLRQRIRRYSVSFVVPMGAEMYYRQQETLANEQLRALRQLRGRLHQLDAGTERTDG